LGVKQPPGKTKMCMGGGGARSEQAAPRSMNDVERELKESRFRSKGGEARVERISCTEEDNLAETESGKRESASLLPFSLDKSD